MLSEDVGVYLASEGFGTMTPGGSIATEERPTPDDLIVLREYEGQAPLYTKSPAETDGIHIDPTHAERPRIQVMCRSKSTHTAIQRAFDVKAKLDGLRGTLNGVRYRSIRMVGTGPFRIGRDAIGRERVVCNFEALR